MWYLGIDPGVGGGLAVLQHGGAVEEVVKMPPDLAQLFWYIEGYAESAYAVGTSLYATVEKVHSLPGQGHSGAFTFGKGAGAIEMALTALRIRPHYVSPIKWQNAMGCRTGGDKNVSKARAQAMWPDMKVTHALADACLIAEYGRLLHQGSIPSTSTKRKATP